MQCFECSGDGDDGDEKFELILSAETLYTEASCRKVILLTMLQLKLLCSTTGILVDSEACWPILP